MWCSRGDGGLGASPNARAISRSLAGPFKHGPRLGFRAAAPMAAHGGAGQGDRRGAALLGGAGRPPTRESMTARPGITDNQSPPPPPPPPAVRDTVLVARRPAGQASPVASRRESGSPRPVCSRTIGRTRQGKGPGRSALSPPGGGLGRVSPRDPLPARRRCGTLTELLRLPRRYHRERIFLRIFQKMKIKTRLFYCKVTC